MAARETAAMVKARKLVTEQGMPERDLRNRHLQEAYNMGRKRVLDEMRLERERLG